MLEEMKNRFEERMGDLIEKLEDTYRIEFTWTDGSKTCWDNVKNVVVARGEIWFDVERDDRWNRVFMNVDEVRFVEFMGKVED